MSVHSRGFGHGRRFTGERAEMPRIGRPHSGDGEEEDTAGEGGELPMQRRTEVRGAEERAAPNIEQKE